MNTILEDEKAIALDKEKEQEFFENFGKEQKSVPASSETTELNQEKTFGENPSIVAAPEIDKVDELIIDTKEEIKPEIILVNQLNEKVSKYAESIGIKPEELAYNSEFLNLSPEQQRFALETLRRTSFAKARVEAHQTFAEEKASKKWWQIGFVMNQNFHKERHKIEAIKNIESRGLEGYGETELAWLTEVIKNGPEVKVNDAGEIIVDCLSDRGFSDEQKGLIALYNKEARNYIESSDKNNQKYRRIKEALINNCSEEELNQLFYNLNEAEKNIQLLKFLSANKETETMIQNMASRSLTGFDKAKAMAGAQKDKAGYSALGFVLRTGSKFALANSAYVASALTYSAAPVIAAMVGSLRGYNQGKKSLVENEELAKLGVIDKSATAKALNLAVGENSLKNKLDNLVDKLERLRNEYASEEEIKKIEESLQARIYYTQGQMNNESVSYGSAQERGSNYLELTDSLVRANSVFWKNTDLVIRSNNYYSTSKKTKALTRQTDLYKGIDIFNKIPDASDPKYKEWAQDKERFEELQKVSIEDRLASFLNYKEDAQSRKELKFLLKKTATGAVMGASFAAVGSFVAEHLGLSNWLSSKLNTGKSVVGVSTAAKALAPSGPKTNIDVSVSKVEVANNNIEETVSKTVTTVSAKNVIFNHEDFTSRIEQAPIEEIKTPVTEIKVEVPSSKISDLNTENITIQTPVASEVTPNTNINTEVVPTQTPVASEVTPNTGTTESVSREVIDAKRDALTANNLINASNNAVKIADGVYSNNVNFRTEEAFLKQVSEISGVTKLSVEEQVEAKNIFNNFKNDNDYNILRRRLISFENKIVSQNVIEAPKTNEIVESANKIPAQVNATTNEMPAINTKESGLEATEFKPSNQVVPENAKGMLNTKNVVDKLVGNFEGNGVNNNNTNLTSETDFLKKVLETTNNFKLTPSEELEAKAIYKNFKSDYDYDMLKVRLGHLVDHMISVNADYPIINQPVEQVVEQVDLIANISSIAKELHVKPELLKQAGDDLVYKMAGKSNIVFDLRVGGIKEVVGLDGKKIPKEFITELMNGQKTSKFARGGGLEKIFTSWNKLDSNDKLMYESLGWFNKKTMKPEDLFGQIRGLYQVNTENVFVDADNKHFITSDGKSFDMNLKGIKKLVAFLPKK